jgi:hypothetical protein
MKPFKNNKTQKKNLKPKIHNKKTKLNKKIGNKKITLKVNNKNKKIHKQNGVDIKVGGDRETIKGYICDAIAYYLMENEKKISSVTPIKKNEKDCIKEKIINSPVIYKILLNYMEYKKILKQKSKISIYDIMGMVEEIIDLYENEKLVPLNNYVLFHTPHKSTSKKKEQIKEIKEQTEKYFTKNITNKCIYYGEWGNNADWNDPNVKSLHNSDTRQYTSNRRHVPNNNNNGYGSAGSNA